MQWIKSIKRNPRMPRLAREESGQSLVLVAAAIVALIAVIGLGVDLGVVYVERVRLARAMDAAALAGAQELPIEAASHERAIEYLIANGYGSGACIETHGSDIGAGAGGCSGSDAETIIIINTEIHRDGGPNTSSKITVEGTQRVPLGFMRVLGVVDSAPVAASATAENIDNLDIAIVYDRSGSMQEDTRCYGCWEATGDYPQGALYPLPLEDPDTGVVVHCQPSDPVEYQGYTYLAIEAEHYSRYLIEADYHMDRTEYPKIWWAMQREHNSNASSSDERSAFMRVGPHSQSALHYPSISDIQFPGEENVNVTPRLDYDFTVPEDGTYYVWMRAQGGQRWGSNPPYSHRSVHVGLGGSPMATGTSPTQGGYNRGAVSGNWRWTRVLPLNLTEGISYTLNFWAAGPGFRLDKIVLTTDPRTDLMEYGHPLDWDVPGVWDAGPAETHGRTDWACHPNDPRFTPADPSTGELDDLYDDRQPIRAAKEAAKKFVSRMDPDLDQVAYVWYSTSSSIREELYCLKRIGHCESFDNVLNAIESTNANGSTNIGDALWDGIRVLITGIEPENAGQDFPSKEPGKQHYGRGNAAHILILMTDGQANYSPSLPSGYGNCYSDDLWPDQPDESWAQRKARECVAWFAHRARNQGVVIYTIGLGGQVDNELMTYVAEITGGAYYNAPSAKELDAVFEELYERIFLRLTE